ncbi:esterase, PHB depolymerase family [Rubrobacter radiotolerans]|uniref:Esterase, PHB depolymerase family n=1 Tax=Rubrobacter radiotolerans TaxID=42256 RepID=A0A023X2G5_RUBRA|nr:PHB depolymerase family esterase [Rubrobacter radiotolerans]AHY46637.1 esterase, PHB depolymerase family [Rubrobacter radiotolerans]MDX5894044.1 PHB depolymerase family esterase [Rubrobacter radiotolerans]SMC05048.1 esterase, PHB depolymerase family [Rubrobacter radiotolerans DSM 5868]
MNDETQRSMFEATRLTGEGRLAEATALIQRALGGGSFPAGPVFGTRSGSEEAPATVETTSRIVRETPAPEEPESGEDRGTEEPPSTDASDGSPLRPAPAWTESFRGFRSPATWTPGASGLAGAWPATEPDAETGEAGRFISRRYANRAGSRAYKLYVPDGYEKAARPVALVVMLHGCTQGADDFAAGTQMNALAERETFLVVYPEQTREANFSGCWNWFEGKETARGSGEASIVAGITCEVLGEYNVDPERVFVAGMSAGGAMAASVAESYPDLYAACGVHSGLAPGSARDLASAFGAMQGGRAGAASPNAGRVPTVVFHGTRDSTVSPKNAAHLLSRQPSRAVRTEEVREPGCHAYTRSVHRDAAGKVIAEHWAVEGLAHAWSGGSSAGSYTDPKGPDATQRMFEFFELVARERREG